MNAWESKRNGAMHLIRPHSAPLSRLQAIGPTLTTSNRMDVACHHTLFYPIYTFYILSFVVFFILFMFRSAKQFSTLIGNKAHYFIIQKKHYMKHLNLFTLVFVYTNKNWALAALETYSLVNIFFYWTNIGALNCNVLYRVFMILNGKL